MFQPFQVQSSDRPADVWITETSGQAILINVLCLSFVMSVLLLSSSADVLCCSPGV